MSQFFEVEISASPNDDPFWEGWNRVVEEREEENSFSVRKVSYGSGKISTKGPDGYITGWIDPVEGAKIALVSEHGYKKGVPHDRCRLLALDTKGRVHDLTSFLPEKLPGGKIQLVPTGAVDEKTFKGYVCWVGENVIKILSQQNKM